MATVADLHTDLRRMSYRLGQKIARDSTSPPHWLIYFKLLTQRWPLSSNGTGKVLRMAGLIVHPIN
jgi:hypothetical protein